MTPKQYLSQIRRLEWAIYLNQEAIDRTRARLDLKGISYDRDRVQSSPADATPELIERLINLETVTEQRRAKLDDLINTIVDQITGMDDIIDQKILYAHYIKGKTLGLISEELHYSYDRIKHRHGTALQLFEKKYGPF